MKVFVTGASGFLGESVVRMAVGTGHSVVALVRPTADVDHGIFVHPAVTIVRGDLRETGNWVTALRGVDGIVHAAAAGTGDLGTQFQSTVVATENLLGALPIRVPLRFVHISSFSVYDFSRAPSKSVLEESCALEVEPQARDAYTTTKLIQERLVREAAAAQGFDLVVLRPGAIYGPGKDWGWGTAMRISGKVALMFAPLADFRLTYVDNCAEAVVAALTAPGAVGGTFNIVDDDLPTHLGYWRLCRKVEQSVPRVIPIPWWLVTTVGQVVRFVDHLAWGHEARLPEFAAARRQDARWKPLRYSNDRARRELGWKPRVSLTEGVARMMASGRDARAR